MRSRKDASLQYTDLRAHGLSTSFLLSFNWTISILRDTLGLFVSLQFPLTVFYCLGEVYLTYFYTTWDGQYGIEKNAPTDYEYERFGFRCPDFSPWAFGSERKRRIMVGCLIQWWKNQVSRMLWSVCRRVWMKNDKWWARSQLHSRLARERCGSREQLEQELQLSQQRNKGRYVWQGPDCSSGAPGRWACVCSGVYEGSKRTLLRTGGLPRHWK